MNKEKIVLIQEIHKRLLNTDLEIPTLLVIGPQSSGKSSVLGRIIGYDILPKGTNLITRCPIIIHLRDSTTPYACFSNETKKFKLEQVCSQICTRTLDICGSNKAISSTPIVITVGVPDALMMTIIDLPGLTKVPIDDQPYDIEQQVEDIVLGYAKMPSAIILAVINANVDIATSESLKIAKKVDPKGIRTLGILTKLDLMDPGTDCIEVLENKVNPLNLGYVGVVNRSQAEQEIGTTMKMLSEKEKSFFLTSVYKKLDARIGSDYLTRRIHELYCSRVELIIGTLKEKLRHLLIKKQNFLDALDRNTYTYNTVLVNYYSCVQQIVSNKKTDCLFVYTGTSILYEFQNIFIHTKSEYNFDALENVRNSTYLFLCEDVLLDVVRINIKLILDDMMIKISTLVRLLKHKISQIKSDLMPKSALKLNKTMCDLIDARNSSLISNLKEYIDIQASYINVNRPDFDFSGVITQSCKASKDNGEKLKHEIIRMLAVRYLDMSRCEIVDYMVKSVYFFFIKYFETKLMTDISGFEEQCVKSELEGVKAELQNKQTEINQIKECYDMLCEEKG